jgi:hypothetical protein
MLQRLIQHLFASSIMQRYALRSADQAASHAPQFTPDLAAHTTHTQQLCLPATCCPQHVMQALTSSVLVLNDKDLDAQMPSHLIAHADHKVQVPNQHHCQQHNSHLLSLHKLYMRVDDAYSQQDVRPDCWYVGILCHVRQNDLRGDC